MLFDVQLDRNFFGDMGEGCYCKNRKKGKKTYTPNQWKTA